MDSNTRVKSAIRLAGGFEAILIIVTWPLWCGSSAFPEVPLLPFSFPVNVSRLMAVGLLLSSLSMAMARTVRWQRTSVLAAICFGILLVAQNQHRLQAWHWLFLIGSSVLLIAPARQQLKLLRNSLAAVYVCSALSRMTPSPVTGMTSAIVYQILAMLNVRGLPPDHSVMLFLCHSLTVAELLIGLALLAQASRRIATIAAVLLHIVLMIVLGPFGLNHHSGVLLWNASLLCSVVVLFAGRTQSADPLTGSAGMPQQKTPKRVMCILAALWLFPISGLFGLADNWPSWQLYSSRPESWVLYVHQDSVQGLPRELAPHIASPAPLSDYCAIKLDRWSLNETGSPMYPEDRFQAAVIESVLNSLPPDAIFRIVISSPKSPFWWLRDERQIDNMNELRSLQQQFFFSASAANTMSR